ncbi:MAG: protease inhibitor I42 family protein [Dehalococcoidales bacterium]|nr:protease inhibitor I42 family protein [Dehalococcoidales bacterium]
MKIRTLATIMLTGLVLFLGACSANNAADNTTPPSPEYHQVVATDEDFNGSANITKQIEVKDGDTITIILDSNATTGFSWTEQAVISDADILTQTGHQYIEPQTQDDTPMVAAGGTEEWTFKASQTGTVKVNLSYDRPWEGGEKGVRTFELTIIVK